MGRKGECMDKVLVDRGLLAECVSVCIRAFGVGDPIEAKLRAILAQPAEAEGVRDYLTEFAEGEVEAKTAIEELQDALSAVTAERDRLLSDNASLRGSCKALGEENKKLKRENKRQGRTIAAMAAKEA